MYASNVVQYNHSLTMYVCKEGVLKLETSLSIMRSNTALHLTMTYHYNLNYTFPTMSRKVSVLSFVKLVDYKAEALYWIVIDCTSVPYNVATKSYYDDLFRSRAPKWIASWRSWDASRAVITPPLRRSASKSMRVDLHHSSFISST